MKAGMMALALALCGWCGSHAVGADDGSHVHVGVGARYWMTIDKLDNGNFDENGVSWLATCQLRSGALVKFEFDLEWMQDGFMGSPEQVYAPQAFVLVGSAIYAAAGVGIYYTDGEFADEPFYALRAGLDLELLPGLSLDVNAIYFFNEWAQLDAPGSDIDTDTVMLGAAVRMKL